MTAMTSRGFWIKVVWSHRKDAKGIPKVKWKFSNRNLATLSVSHGGEVDIIYVDRGRVRRVPMTHEMEGAPSQMGLWGQVLGDEVPKRF